MVFFDPSGVRKIVFGITVFVILVLLSATLFGSSQYLKNARIFAETAYAPVNWSEPQFEKTLALTFDDGPKPIYTEEIVSVLKENDVPATFFLVGEQMIRHPTITRSIVSNGFDVGNHSLTHSRNIHSSSERIHREIVATDRILSAITGHSSIFYRPPYLLDQEFGSIDGMSIDSDVIRTIEEVGPIVVGADAGGEDWETAIRADADIIYEQVAADARDGHHVILLHDAAGAGATADALRELIPALKAEGYRFVPLSFYFGLTREQAMPEVGIGVILSEAVLTLLVFTEVSGGALLYILVVSMVVIAVARIWFIILVRRIIVPLVRTPRFRGILPSVSVIIPAHNESANIEATIHSVMSGSVTPEEVIVVDDASSDNTAKLVRELQVKYDPRLRLLQKERGGSKAAALNAGLPEAAGDVLVCIDADTTVSRHALRRLLYHFHDTKVGAVAGKVYPASLRSFFEKLQYLEYVQAQNLDKEVFSVVNAVGIVPGAIGAWRKTAVVNAGGYSLDTVVEDQDLSLALLLRGWNIVYEPEALGYTETPTSAQTFFKQRFRWVHGTMQCFRKYEAWFASPFAPRMGFIVLPNLLLFNLIIPLAAPLVDIAFFASVFGIFNVPLVATIFIFFILFDLLYAYEGLRLEEKPTYSLIPLIPIQRWVYRYIVAAAMFKSVVAALAGTLVVWATPSRRGTASREWALVQAKAERLQTQISKISTD
ncbi:MAG: polysaccharide deacetylase/glycosyl transferase, group 2 family protein [Parcubacteria group bacterium Gr01-1014_8]|nr:MAG: polysaccharide deacetylase/glycosyl transferase, group 2 family protein [Parcubacteria group bacterium Gr01-1014_8]